MKKFLSERYREVILSFLKEIENQVYFNFYWEHINKKLPETYFFEDELASHILHITDHKTAVGTYPFLPRIATVNAPSDISETENVVVLEFEDLRYQNQAPISIAIFENSRRILWVYGLRLDTKEGGSEYSTNDLHGDGVDACASMTKAFLEIKNGIVLTSTYGLIHSFRCSDKEGKQYQLRALNELYAKATALAMEVSFKLN